MIICPSPRSVLLAGVFFGALSMWCSGQASARFAFMWEAYLDKDSAGQTKWFNKGNQWLYGHWGTFALSILLFMIASWLLAGSFSASAK